MNPQFQKPAITNSGWGAAVRNSMAQALQHAPAQAIQPFHPQLVGNPPPQLQRQATPLDLGLNPAGSDNPNLTSPAIQYREPPLFQGAPMPQYQHLPTANSTPQVAPMAHQLQAIQRFR